MVGLVGFAKKLRFPKALGPNSDPPWNHATNLPLLIDLATKSVEHFEKIYSSINRTEIILDEEHEKVVEFIVHVNHHILSSKDHSYSFEQSVHAASDKMIAQLRKLKEKQSDSR